MILARLIRDVSQPIIYYLRKAISKTSGQKKKIQLIENSRLFDTTALIGIFTNSFFSTSLAE